MFHLFSFSCFYPLCPTAPCNSKEKYHYKKACEKWDFSHYTAYSSKRFLLLQTTVLERKKNVWTKNKTIKLEGEQNPTSAGYYASPKLILLFFGVSVIPVQQWYQQINYNVQNNIFFFLIKTRTFTMHQLQLCMYKSYRVKACQCRHLGSRGTRTRTL